MHSESISFLNEHYGMWEMLDKAGIVKHIDEATKNGLLNVIRREWDAGYIINSWCADCVARMITFAYTQYDKWLKEQGERIKGEQFNS